MICWCVIQPRELRGSGHGRDNKIEREEREGLFMSSSRRRRKRLDGDKQNTRDPMRLRTEIRKKSFVAPKEKRVKPKRKGGVGGGVSRERGRGCRFFRLIAMCEEEIGASCVLIREERTGSQGGFWSCPVIGG